MPETGGFPLSKRAIFLAVLGLLGLALILWYATNRRTDTSESALNPDIFATLRSMSPGRARGIMFSEDSLEQFPYLPSSYAQYAEALPADTPCATWENGGIRWWDLGPVSFEKNPELAEEHPELLEGWDVVVAFPDFRFCGFLAPYPEKPEEMTPSP